MVLNRDDGLERSLMRIDPIEGNRVKGIVGQSIMVHLYDVVPGDILCVRDSEGDPIIDEIKRDGESVKFVYRPRPTDRLAADESLWMHPDSGGHVFIHDLKNERLIFQET